MYTQKQIEAKCEQSFRVKHTLNRDEVVKGMIAGGHDGYCNLAFGTSCKKLTLAYCRGYCAQYYHVNSLMRFWGTWIQNSVCTKS